MKCPILRGVVVAVSVVGIAGWMQARTQSLAMTRAKVTMPDTMEVAGSRLQLNGMGVRSFTMLHIHGYVAGLYLPEKTADAAQAVAEPGPKALMIEFVHAASAKKVHDIYTDASTAYCRAHACTQADRAAFDALLSTVQAVKPGDRTGFLLTDKGVDVLFDGAPQTSIDDPRLGRLIVDSNIGSTAPSDAYRAGLLGAAVTD